MDEAALQVAVVPPGTVPTGPPLILQVSPPPNSSDPEEYFYDSSADVDCGDFAAAQAFFLSHGYTVTVHACTNLAEFQVFHMGIAVRHLLVIPPDLIEQGHELLLAQISRFRSLAAGEDNASVCLFLSRYTGPGSSVTASRRSTTSRGLNPPPLEASFLMAHATQGSCPFLPVVHEFTCPCHPPPPAASRHPDPVGVEAASLSQHSRAPSSEGYPHPNLAYDCGFTRGYPQPIPYGGASYYPFTTVDCGGQGHHVSMDGGGTPFPVPHLGHHGGVTFASFNCQIPSAGVPSYVTAVQLIPGTMALGGIPMRLHWWCLCLGLPLCRCIL
jgi:hypothetical protein